MTMLAEVFSGEADWADVFFIVAAVAAVVAAVGSFGTNQVTKHADWLLCVAVACAAFGLALL
jgi:phosphopantothenoylcysteine synthetase/decarboxylase